MPRELLGKKDSGYLPLLFQQARQHFRANPDDIIYRIPHEAFSNYEVLQVEGKIYVVNVDPQYCLGQGGFGRVVICQSENGDCFAMKQEKVNATLRDEHILRHLNKLHGIAYQPTNNEGEWTAYSVLKMEPGKELLLQVWDKTADGKSIALKDRIPSLTDRLVIALKSAYELQWLHMMGIVHADIKGENLMCEANATSIGNAYFINSIDFGLSYFVGYGLNRNDADSYQWVYDPIRAGAGTKDFIAPECHEGWYGFPSDVFAFGEMLLGDLQLEQHLNDLSPEVLRIIQTAKHQDYHMRPTMLDLVAALTYELKNQIQHQDNPDQSLIQLISICERHLHQMKVNIGESEETRLSSKLLGEVYEHLKTYEKTNVAPNIEDLKKLHYLLFQDLSNEDKLIAFKGFLEKSGLESEFSNELKQIDKLYGRARFLGREGCSEFFDKLKGKEITEFTLKINSNIAVLKQGKCGLKTLAKIAALRKLQGLMEKNYNLSSIQTRTLKESSLDQLLDKLMSAKSVREIHQIDKQVRKLVKDNENRSSEKSSNTQKSMLGTYKRSRQTQRDRLDNPAKKHKPKQ